MAPSCEETPYTHTDQDAGMRVVQVDSLSLCGLSFVSLHAYSIGAPVWIRIRLGAKTCQFKGVVRRAGAAVHAGRMQHVCGVQFTRSQQTAHAVAVVSSFMETASLRRPN
ncbi:hypothetical protein CCAX7_32960 [Capsulimonas corticalis]|uniref:Uncharacterized protein n=2 Tax=Capsulimonas corticalis TaxID=2219043 RepID=A0A402CYU1_9BACT|nr:hypothetical protein CCAX7_32960 [Capsulimonas corticalis]